MKFESRWTQAVFAILITYLFFTASRILLFIYYPDSFSNLLANELTSSLLMGLRVDTAIIFTFFGLPFLLLVLPLKIVYNKLYRSAIGLYWGITLAFMMVINLGDIFYFGFVNRHLDEELSVIENDIGSLVDIAFTTYLLEVIIGTIVLIALVLYFFYIFRANIENQEINKRAWWSVPVIIVVAFLGIRGKVSGISFGVSDAFAVNKLASGNLALNGFFCLYRSGSKASVKHNHIEYSSALKTVKKLVSSEKTRYMGQDFPIYRSYGGHTQLNSSKKPNVIIIMVESMSAKYVDSFTHNNFGVTPFIDELSEKSLKYTNFFANGQRSLAGITAIFAGITPMHGFSHFGEGLELSGLSYLGKIADNNGYKTISMQSSLRGSFRVDKLSELAGFKEYYGSEDFEHVGDEINTPTFGSWDGDMLSFLSKKLHNETEPFLSFSFTSSTHAPFITPGKKYEKYPHDSSKREGYLNTLNYLDQKLKEFFVRSKKEPWFDNTIFIITADHCLAHDLQHKNSDSNINKIAHDPVKFLKDNHIPLIVYGPKYFEAEEKTLLASQVDILPSLMDILRFNDGFASISNSIFDNSVKNRFVTMRQGPLVAFAQHDAAVYYNFKTFLETEGNVSRESDLQNKLLSIDTVKAKLLKTSKWSKAE